MSKLKKIYIRFLLCIIPVLFFVWVFYVPKSELAAKSEISIRYELYNNFINTVKHTFGTSDYNHIYIKWDGFIRFYAPNLCEDSNISNYEELNDAYDALYPQKKYRVDIFFDSNGKVAALLQYDKVKASSKKATIYELVYKEEGFEKINESGIDYAREIPGVKEWYYWSEGYYYE